MKKLLVLVALGAAALTAHAQATRNPVPPGPGEGYYDFVTHGASAGTLKDITDHSADLVFGPGNQAPTQKPYGVAFNPQAQNSNTWIVTPFKTFKTIYFVTSQPEFPVGTGYGYNPVGGDFLMGPTNGVKGGGVYFGGAPQPNINGYTDTYRGTSTHRVYDAGIHVYSLACGSMDNESPKVNATWAVDGVQVDTYKAQNPMCSTVPLTGATYQIGGYNQTSFGPFNGYVYALAVYQASHTSAQQAAVSQWLLQQVKARAGLPGKYVHGTSTARTFIATMDSLSSGFNAGGSGDWFNNANIQLTQPYTLINRSITGMTAAVENSSFDYFIKPYIGNPQSIVAVWGGTNDILGSTAEEIWGNIQSIGKKVHAEKARSILVLPIGRHDKGANTLLGKLAEIEAREWKTSGAFDAAIDPRGIPALADNPALIANNTACYQADGLHLTGPGTGSCATLHIDGRAVSVTGYSVFAKLYGAAQARLDGHSSPDNAFATTANAFVETYDKTAVRQTPTAAATHTLVDCIGQTEPSYVINAAAGSSITVASVSRDQPIVGNATVAPGATGIFQPVLKDPMNGGCGWHRAQ